MYIRKYADLSKTQDENFILFLVKNLTRLNIKFFKLTNTNLNINFLPYFYRQKSIDIKKKLNKAMKSNYALDLNLKFLLLKTINILRKRFD